MKTKGEIEAAICEAIIRFEQDHMGRGPKDIRQHIGLLLNEPSGEAGMLSN